MINTMRFRYFTHNKISWLQIKAFFSPILDITLVFQAHKALETAQVVCVCVHSVMEKEGDEKGTEGGKEGNWHGLTRYINTAAI